MRKENLHLKNNTMPDKLTVELAKPVTSVKALTAEDAEKELNSGTSAAEVMQDSESQKATLSQLLLTLKGLVDKLNQFYDKVFTEHREAIAKLSVEIARKILMQKVQEGDYEIESIIKEALESAPTRQDVVVHLNAEDLVKCEKIQQDDAAGALAGIKFVGDSNIGRAECLLETPKGTIESVIDEHLERIGKSLESARHKM